MVICQSFVGKSEHSSRKKKKLSIKAMNTLHQLYCDYKVRQGKVNEVKIISSSQVISDSSVNLNINLKWAG